MPYVLESVIVPNDTREHVKHAIRRVLQAVGRTVVVVVVFSDDYMKDHNSIHCEFEDLGLHVLYHLIINHILTCYLQRFQLCVRIYIMHRAE